ncbi:MAG: flagellin, partial [Lachnospiraceae bacterium]|nr:flagellin [Lachnospiraceae bacterium]
MVIFNNMAAMSALNETNRSNNKLGKVVKQASSGMRINSAGDDASGYSISEKMRVQLRALSQDIENVQTGHNLVATAEGGIQEIIENLRYLKEKAISAANDHNTDADRELIQKEVNQRIDEINDIASSTTYNGRVLLNGNYREYVPASTTINIDYNFKANTLNDLT